MIEFQKVLRLSTSIGTVWFESMKRNNFCLMASKDRRYHQGKNSRTYLPKIVHYAYTMVQLSSSPGSGLFCSRASVLLCSSVTASRFIWPLLQTRGRVWCNMQGRSLYSMVQIQHCIVPRNQTHCPQWSVVFLKKWLQSFRYSLLQKRSETKKGI